MVDQQMLQGRVAVVTGGAGGIGAATCRILAEHGADVVVADKEAERAVSVVLSVEDTGRRAIAVTEDLTQVGAVERLHTQATEVFGHVDILVNGLGHHLASSGPFEESTEEQWDALYQINLLHVLRACKAFAPAMCRAGWGRIVNFSSVEGIRAMPHGAVYAAFKGAVDSFTQSLGVALARRGVRVNCVAVDKVRSEQVGWYRLPEEYERLAPVWIPAGRYGEGEDVAKVVLFLASDMSSWLVGRTIAADGGTLAAGGWYPTPTRWTNSPLLLQYFEDDPSINEGRPRTLQ
jgi:NAD(P)-dependent dehydrogenase (short-subunit alcohol dehydrogenase family)